MTCAPCAAARTQPQPAPKPACVCGAQPTWRTPLPTACLRMCLSAAGVWRGAHRPDGTGGRLGCAPAVGRALARAHSGRRPHPACGSRAPRPSLSGQLRGHAHVAGAGHDQGGLLALHWCCLHAEWCMAWQSAAGVCSTMYHHRTASMQYLLSNLYLVITGEHAAMA